MSQPSNSEHSASHERDLIGDMRAEADATGVEFSANTAPGERAGDQIDRYKLLEEIGEGGMGTVWMAQQSEPVKRKVALKIIKLGMDTREVVLRFEAERQALALMDHPHIAKVLDGGATQSGRPYFVMELVRGTPITDYCDRAKLGLRERLELFSRVCEAIQHAHHKGIIHRDIKPSNVMVTLHDGVPAPKVIDFGIAKATSAELTQKTLFTQYKQIIGTPEYMAPEQAEMSGLDIDTRADVYSLGVLLYELITGTKPFDIRTALELGYEEMLRTIREVDPAKPSQRISTLGQEATPIAARRHIEVTDLAKRLRGDLDWIVMKALEKDRTRRYETANSFAADIGRNLAHEPVLAAPPSALYRMRKFVQRRKATVIAVAVIAVLVVAGSVGTGVGWWRTSQANNDLDVALEEKSVALGHETEARQHAESSEKRAREAESLAKAETNRASANESRALQAEAEAKAETERANAAEQEASQRAKELDQVATFQAEQLNQVAPQLMGEHLRQALIESSIEERRDSLSADLAGTNFTNLALELLQENLFDQTLEAIDAQFPDQPLVRAQLLGSMAKTLVVLGLYDDAVDPMQRTLAIRREQLGDEHPDTLYAIINLGFLLKQQGKLDEAEPYHREALAGMRRVLGDEHLETLIAINNMGTLLVSQGKLNEAQLFWGEALEANLRVFGDEHPNTLTSLNNMGYLFDIQGKLDEAEPYYRDALDTMRRVLGNEHFETLIVITNLGALLRAQGRLDEAQPYYQEALDGNRRVFGDEHPNTLVSINNMGRLLETQGKLDEAEPYYREAVEGMRRVLGNDHQSTLLTIRNLGVLLTSMGKLTEAQPFDREALVGLRRVFGDEHKETQGAASAMAQLLAMLISAERVEDDQASLGLHLSELGSLELLQGANARAENSLAEGFELLFEVHGDKDWRTQTAMAALGSAIAEQGRFEEAEPMLLESAEWLFKDGSVPAGELWMGEEPVSLAARRAAEFYAAWHTAKPGAGHDKVAAGWRKKQNALGKQRGL